MVDRENNGYWDGIKKMFGKKNDKGTIKIYFYETYLF